MYYYSICITRMDLISLEDNNPITLDEWMQVVENDKELTPIKLIEGRNPRTKEIVYIEVDNYAAWKHDKEDHNVKFFYQDGKICTLDYDEYVGDNMHRMAKRLGGKVVDRLNNCIEN